MSAKPMALGTTAWRPLMTTHPPRMKPRHPDHKPLKYLYSLVAA